MAVELTRIEVTNKALVLIGALPITTFEETTAEAVVANNVYEDVVEDALSKHDWSFATGQKRLQRLADTPLTQYTSAYALPTDPRPVGISRVWAGDEPIPFNRVEDRIECSVSNETARVVLEYQYRAGEPNWTSAFRWYVIYRLASEFASVITRSSEQVQMWDAKAERQFQLAVARNDKGRQSPLFSQPVINEAVARLGVNPLTPAQHSVIETMITNGTYQTVLQACAGREDWGFGVRNVSLEEATLTGSQVAISEHHQAYDISWATYADTTWRSQTMSGNFVAFHELYVQGRKTPFWIEGDRLWVDLERFPPSARTDPSVVLVFQNLQDEDDWSASFREYVVLSLAAAFAGGTFDDPRVAQTWTQAAERAFLLARRENNRSRPAPRLRLRTSRLTGTR